MTSYFSLFVLMLSITIGMNVLAAAFEKSPAFDEIDDDVFKRIGTEIPTKIGGSSDKFETSTTKPFIANEDCANLVITGDGLLGTADDTLLEELCNPTKQNLQTTSTAINNITTTTTAIGTTETAQIGSLETKVSTPSQLEIGSIDDVIALLTGEFILRAVAGAFFGFCTEQNDPSCDPDSQLPELFVDGFRVIVLLMFAGMILSLLFGRSLATAG